MIHTYKQIIIIFLFTIFGFFGLNNNIAFADVIEGLDEAAKIGYGGKQNPDVPGMIGTAIGAVLAFVGTIFFILMIYGGILWMTSVGNEEQVKKARGVLVAAVIGLIIVLSAYAITAYIGETFGATPGGPPDNTPPINI